MESARSISVRVLNKIDKEGYSDLLLESQTYRDYRDECFTRALVLGVLEKRNSLDFFIRSLSKTPFHRLHWVILQVLRLAIYQLYYMDQEDYAVINEMVDVAGELGPRRLKGFVNGILRNALRRKDQLLAALEDEEPEVRYNLSPEIIGYLKDNYGARAMDLIRSFDHLIPMTLRVNPEKISREEAFEIFQGQGMEPELSEICHTCIRLAKPHKVHQMEIFLDGSISIQGEGSSLVVQLMDLPKGARVLDLCAAPGSKSLMIAEAIGEKGQLVANDISRERAARIEENLQRGDYKSYQLTNYDAAEYQEDFVNSFDFVLVDAPCSALGLIAKKPEIRYSRTLEQIKELAQLQRKILKNAISYLKEGGRLFYSTCTYGSLENEENRDFVIGLGLRPWTFDYKGETQSQLQLFTDTDRTDGFYISSFY